MSRSPDRPVGNSKKDRPGNGAASTVAVKIRQLRKQAGFSLKALADRAALNINTLSLIETGKTSPSVATLQQLARGLEVPITAFFESESVPKQVVFTLASRRPRTAIGDATLENLAEELGARSPQVFVVSLEPAAEGEKPLVAHPGYEFAFCLSGVIRYEISGVEYLLHSGDAVAFESHLPHRWGNALDGESRMLLSLYPGEGHDESRIPLFPHA